MDDMKALGSRLAEARRLAGLSQGAVAQSLGIRRPAISEMEFGRRNVKTGELSSLAKLYGVSAEWLSTGESAKGMSPKIEMIARSLADLKDDDLAKLTAVIQMLKDDGNE